jgi:(p)ppGpp synthase/HD superfamily hydrolase
MGAESMSSLVSQAKEFALAAHGDQKYGSHPYEVHLDAVAELARPYGEQAEMIAYLHDVVEDTEVDIGAIAEVFGEFIAECVAILTDAPGSDRKERKQKTYARMAGVSGDLEIALVVKAADRVANMRACVADGSSSLLAVYKGEHATFRGAAFRPDLCADLWFEMDQISQARDTL